jgi:cytoskeletal protein CcmA (bactofilin family)
MSDGTTGKMASKRTLVEEGSVFKGSLESVCPIVVLGQVDGEITGPSIEVHASGQVSGRIKATQVTSRGELAGNVEAETVELSGRVRDQTVIRARSIEVKLERGDAREEVVFGDCELCIGEELVKETVLNEAAAARRAATEPTPPPAPTPARPVPPPLPEPRAATAAAAGPPADPVSLEEAALAGRSRRNTGATIVDMALPPKHEGAS